MTIYIYIKITKSNYQILRKVWFLITELHGRIAGRNGPGSWKGDLGDGP